MSFSQLMSSMRFAISMLSVVGLASIIGTVLQQNQPYESYIINFGQFWFELFEMLSLYNVYQATWFLLILFFLVASTSLCVSRNTPQVIKDIRRFQENIREESLKRNKYVSEISIKNFKKSDLVSLLKDMQFKVREKKINGEDDLIVAKKGDFQKLGYIFTHMAIIIISVGGLMDGNLVFKFKEAVGIKKIEMVDKPISEIAKKSWLETSNFSYRANMLLVEGESQDVGVIPVKDGYLIQDLPFSVALKDFKIEHYASGQPKSFESDLIVKNKKNGKVLNKKISVNKPLTVNGVTIYQSDFQDGGSKLNLNLIDLYSAEKPLAMKAAVFKHNILIVDDQKLNFEFEDFRLFNILDIGLEESKKPTNVGPNFRHKIRDVTGQAREYETYQHPMVIDGRYFFMSGMRNTPQEDYRYLRIPADAERSLEGFMVFKNLIRDRKKVTKATVEIARKSSEIKEVSRNLANNFQAIFDNFVSGGYNNIALNIDENVPDEKQEQVAGTYLKIIHLIADRLIVDFQNNNSTSSLFNFDDVSVFTQDALNGYSDSFFYGSNFWIELKDFEHIQASGLQLTKSPGQFWVYLGSIMLVLGIFCMIYIQEARLWIVRKKGSKKVTLAFASNREHLEFEKFVLDTKAKIKKFYLN